MLWAAPWAGRAQKAPPHHPPHRLQKAQWQEAKWRAYLQQSLQNRQNSRSYADWQQHPLNPEHWLPQFDPHLLCQQMGAMPSTQVNLFYKALLQMPQPPSCVRQILQQHQNYIRSTRARLKQQSLMQWRGAYKGGASDLKFGPSREVLLNPTQTPFVVAQHLSDKQIVFSFDDGPHPSLTSLLLDDLREHQIQAHFFVVGRPVLRHPKMLRYVQNEGHIIGTHSQTHKLLTRLPLSQAKTEICQGFRSTLQALKGVSTPLRGSLREDDFLQDDVLLAPFFRFPYGAFNSVLKQFVRQSNWANFFWRVDTLDWKYHQPKQLLAYTLQQINKAKRGVVLMHDIQPQTISIMPSLLIELAARGYKSVFYQPTYWLKKVQDAPLCAL